MPKELIPYIVPAIVFALVAWRLFRNARGRPIKPQMLWIRPAFLAVFLGLAFLHPPAISPLSVAVFVCALLLGAGFGYLLARHQTLTIDTATGTITSKTSPLGTVLFLGLFVLRFATRRVMMGGQPDLSLTHQSPAFMMYTDAGLIFVLGLVAAQAWETWNRAKPLLDGHAAENLGKPPISLQK
jgi:hypothetical protein